MRTIVVLEDLGDTGANRVSIDRAFHWHRSGDDVTVFVTLRSVDAAAAVPVPAELRVVFGARGRRLRSTLVPAAWKLILLARRANVVVAGTEVGFALLLARLATRVARRPFAVTVQSRVDLALAHYVSPRLQAITRAALAGADLAVCVADGLVASTTAVGVPADRVVAVRNAVPRAELRSRAAHHPEIEWDRAHPLVVGVGRLVWQKGFDLLIRAHAKALADGAPAHQLMILGDGTDERAALENLAAQLGVTDSVRLPGFLTNPHAVVSRATLFALPSRWEGFPLCLTEALACGTPCVAFDCVAGPSEVLDGGRYGGLLPAEDVTALAGALRAHLADPGPLRAKAELADADDLDMFDPAGAAQRHRAALARLVGRASRR